MLLGSSKADIDKIFGRPLMARKTLGLPGEQAALYPWGDFEILVGFLQNIARYAGVRRRQGPGTPFSPAELAGILALNAPASLWTTEVPDAQQKKTASSSKSVKTTKIEARPASYFSYVEKDPKVKDKVLREIRGWAPGSAPYAFFYLPSLDGHPPVLVSEWGVHKILG